MSTSKYRDLLTRTCETALAYLDTLPDRKVAAPVDYRGLLANLGGPLLNEPTDPIAVVDRLVEAAGPGLVATPGPRYFGFVIGGALPASVAAEWLAATWDQNAFSYVLSPAAAATEEVVRQWLIELFRLPDEMSLGLTTGATMANFTALAAGRHALLRDAAWDVEERGLYGAPNINVVTSDESHVTIFAPLQMLGLGRGRVSRVATDDQGRMRVDALRTALAAVEGPVLVCAQAGNVNTGSFDPLPEIAACVHERGGWLHVDGAFGMWAAATTTLAHLVSGVELADSIAVDCHKWLNVPYDSGLVFVKDQAAHQAAMTLNAPYYVSGGDSERENHNWVPESSRRARGFAVWAALRSLGRQGIAAIVERCCALARRMAEHLRPAKKVQILNDVVLNQILVRFGDSDARTAEVIRRTQRDGTCWAGGTMWHGMHAMRISVSNWSTSEADIDRSAEAILRSAAMDV